MKTKHIKKLLDSIRKNNKDYVFVEYCYQCGMMNIPISYGFFKRLEKLMEKKGIKYKPSLQDYLELHIRIK